MCYWVRIILFVIDKDVSHVLLGTDHPSFLLSFLLLIRMCLMCYWVRIILFVIDKDVSHVLLGTDHPFVIDKDVSHVLLGHPSHHPFCY